MLAVKQQRTVFKSPLDLDVWSLLLLLHTWGPLMTRSSCKADFPQTLLL